MISLILAVGIDGEIGNDNKLLWNIPEDLKRFKEKTMLHKVIMGRKTYESIGKPLPHRINMVISNSLNQKDHSDIYIINSEEELYRLTTEYENNDEEIFVIGGKRLYDAFFPYATKVYLTQVYKKYSYADTKIDITELLHFKIDSISNLKETEDGLKYRFIDFSIPYKDIRANREIDVD